MNRKRANAWSAALAMALLVIGGGLALADEPAGTSSTYRVLIVDGSKTLNATMRVVGLASAIGRSGFAEVTVQLADGLGPFVDPLTDQKRPDEPYQLIILVPRGVDDATAYGIWILLPGDPQATPEAAQAVALLGAGIDAAFSGIASAVGPTDDLWAALTAALYVQEGWLE